MEIVLARHGRPNFSQREWITPSKMGDWIRNWDLADVVNEVVPSDTLQRAANSRVIVTSFLRRSVLSAGMLGNSTLRVSEAIFSEADLPYSAWRLPRLPAATWAVVFRVAWLFGYSRNAESVAVARVRARQCALRLIELAGQYQSVFLVGHGIMTILIARQLLALGWSGPKRPLHGYWGYAAYTDV